MADAIIEKQAEYIAEQQEHQKKIAENYRKLLDSASPAREEREEARPAPAYSAPMSAPAYAPLADNAARIRDYNAYRVSGERTLANGAAPAAEELVMSVPAADAMPTATTMRTQTGTYAEDPDVLPTPATMAMLARVEAAEASGEIQDFGFFASLPAKLKVAFTVVAAAILVAIAVIFINTSVLRSMDSRIESARASLQQLDEHYREVQRQIDEATDPGSIADWAEENNMFKD